eukprot:UN10918
MGKDKRTKKTHMCKRTICITPNKTKRKCFFVIYVWRGGYNDTTDLFFFFLLLFLLVVVCGCIFFFCLFCFVLYIYVNGKLVKEKGG